MKCLHCKLPIPAFNVQQGGMHMGCYNEEIVVWKVTIYGSTYYEEHLQAELEYDIVQPHTISRGEFTHMKEFNGF